MIDRSNPSSLPKNTSFSLWVFILFLGYMLLLSYFRLIDVYHHNFFTAGFTVVIYNIIRVIFILYLMWFFYTAGDLLLRVVIGKHYLDDLTLINALLAFFSGVGIWHIALFIIGFTGFYTPTVMITISLIVFTFSLPRLNQWIRFAQDHSSAFNWQGWLILILPLFCLLITKGLYPAGGHDYYNHYFPYYLNVIKTGSIMPNEVWYHFYYSKGDGLFFLSMLLTDPLAPQLATTALILAGAATIFVTLKPSATKWRLLPWLGAAFYLAFLIYTPGLVENLHENGWADFEKSHEPASVLMFVMIWITMELGKTKDYRKWGISLLLSMSALTLINPFMALFAAAYLAIAAAFFYYFQKKPAAFYLLTSLLLLIAWFLFISGINFYLTGIPDELKLVVYWPFIDFQKVNHWGVLYEVLKLSRDRIMMASNKLPLFSKHFFQVWLSYIRLEVWGPLFLVAVSVFGLRYSQGTHKTLYKGIDKAAIYANGGFLLLVLFLSIFIGRDLATSYYRFTIFSYAPMLCFCLLLTAPGFNQTKATTLLFFVSFLIGFNLSKHYLNYEGKPIREVFRNSLQFITGRYSLASAYQNQQGWPGRMPWGGIYPGMQTIWEKLPRNTRIWSMHIHSYCMLPDCRMESFPSYRFSPHAAVIYYGNPLAAETWLKKEGLNYFFYSTTLVFNATDPLPLSPLFSPDHIADYLGIAWTNGKDYLLTWKEDARYPINAKWIAQYQQKIINSDIHTFPYEELHTAWQTFAKSAQLKESDLPWNASPSS